MSGIGPTKKTVLKSADEALSKAEQGRQVTHRPIFLQCRG